MADGRRDGDTTARRAIPRFVGIALAAGLLTIAGCDFDVTNPGPVADEFLNEPGAYSAVVNGIGREMNDAMNWIGIDVAVRTRELHATQANDFIGILISAHRGTADLDQLDTHWESGHRARWMGEDAIRRFREAIPEGEFDSHPQVSRAHLWTGYANRLLGEYFCEAVFDGGEPQPGDAYFERAEEVFTTAIEVGDAAGREDLVTAGHAGRASARVHLGDWSGAVADASEVPTDFSFTLPYYEAGEIQYYNAFYYYGNANEPYHSLTTWNTFYHDYFAETEDPRTPWYDDPADDFGSGSLQPWGPVPWFPQGKHDAADSSVELSSGEEMRLVEAEALLREGAVDDAMELINDLRERAGVEAWPEPESLEEAWSYLKKERGIELWLEGRRLGDQRRWAENDTPGALPDEELGLTEDGPDLGDRLLCLPISTSERETNPNVP